MPYKDRQIQLQYWNNYQKKRRKEKTRYLVKYHQDRKKLVIEALGGRCACCWTVEDLTIDHIIPTKRKANQPTLNTREVIKSNFDKTKFQVLCRRCNRSKADTIYCRLRH